MVIDSSPKAYQYLRRNMRLETEEIWSLALNTEKRLLNAKCLFRGTVDSCMFHPRDLFRHGIKHNSTGLILAHNHPSGNPQPSDSDFAMTKLTLQAAKLLQIPLLDHLIVSELRYFSFADSGWMQEVVKDREFSSALFYEGGES